jgi:hypothetical protein
MYFRHTLLREIKRLFEALLYRILSANGAISLAISLRPPRFL